jgi:hypothetical protein
MGAYELQRALNILETAIREVNGALHTIRAEHDPLAVHIFVSRRHYRRMSDTKSGKRHEAAARISWQRACELGFRGDLYEWQRLLGAASSVD